MNTKSTRRASPSIHGGNSRPPRLSLRISLVLALALCLIALWLAQGLGRYLTELPELYEQEFANDVVSVERVKVLFAREFARLEDVVLDNGHWHEAYDFLRTEQGGTAYRAFVKAEFSFLETVHLVPRVDGYTYFRRNGKVFFESAVDSSTLQEDEPLSLPLSALLPVLPDERGATGTGFVATQRGPVLFAITGITNDSATLDASGYLVAWRRADPVFFKEVLGNQPIDFDHRSAVSQPDLVARLQQQEHGVEPRGDANTVRWLLEDISGEPLFVVTQQVAPRTFNTGLVARSTLLEVGASSLFLVLFALFVSRRVVTPIQELGRFAEEVTESDDNSRRLEVVRRDEIGYLTERFNELLERVHDQEQTLRSQNLALRSLSEIDPLTGIANRRVFEQTLSLDWAHALRTGRSLACLMIDIDAFKAYNDHYGHQAGDRALRQVAEVLADRVNRATDRVCRYGGEEFVVLLSDAGGESAALIAEDMLRSIEQLAIPHDHSRYADHVTASAGVAAMVPTQERTARDLVEAADRALYKAKRAGGNRVLRDSSREVSPV